MQTKSVRQPARQPASRIVNEWKSAVVAHCRRRSGRASELDEKTNKRDCRLGRQSEFIIGTLGRVCVCVSSSGSSTGEGQSESKSKKRRAKRERSTHVNWEQSLKLVRAAHNERPPESARASSGPQLGLQSADCAQAGGRQRRLSMQRPASSSQRRQAIFQPQNRAPDSISPPPRKLGAGYCAPID